MMTWREFDQRFITDKVVDVRVNLMTEVGSVPTYLPRYERRATVKQLLDLKKEHEENKPKQFIWGFIPRPTYAIDMVDWSYIAKRLDELTSFTGPVDLNTYIIWYD